MIRFSELEHLGLSVAAMSGIAEGDCSLRTPEGASRAQAFCGVCGVDWTSLACVSQVHGNHVHLLADRPADHDPVTRPRQQADGIATGFSGLPMAIFVADCVPVLLFEPVRRVAALLHAGREGTWQRICSGGVALLARELGAVPERLHAVIGPSAGPCCYEVSPEMAREYGEAGFAVTGCHLDLWAENRRQLLEAGIPPDQLHVSGVCTICSGAFHSYRRGDATARNMVLLSL